MKAYNTISFKAINPWRPDTEYIDFIASHEDIEEMVIDCKNIEEVRKAISKLSEEEIDLCCHTSGAEHK